MRRLRRYPVAVCATIASVGLTIGALTVLFTVIRAVLLTPPPFEKPSELVSIARIDREGARRSVSFPEFAAWRERTDVLRAAAAAKWEDVDLLAPAETTRIRQGVVTPDFFSVLGVRPLLGRVFTPSDEGGSRRLVILSEDAWSRFFGRAPDVIGATIALRSHAGLEQYEIVGVVDRAVRLHALESLDTYVLLPRSPALTSWLARPFHVVGRLQPGRSPEQANATLRSAGEYAPAGRAAAESVDVISLREEEARPFKGGISLLGLALALVLLLACVNVATLMIALAEARKDEWWVRTACGATPGHLRRLILGECAAIGAMSGLAGLVLGAISMRALLAAVPVTLPSASGISITVGTAVFAVATGLVCGLMFGLPPALIHSRPIVRAQPGWATATPGSRWGYVMLALLLSGVTVLMVCAALVVRSAWALTQVELGYDTTDVVGLELMLPKEYWTPAERYLSFQRHLFDGVAAAQGVEAIALASDLPPTAEGLTVVRVADRSARALQRTVSPGYFGVLKVQLLAGRVPDPFDPAEGGVLVNEHFVTHLLPRGSPIGQTFVLGSEKIVHVAGVVANAREWRLEEDFKPTIYTPFGAERPLRFWILLRSREPARLEREVRAVVRALDPSLPVGPLTPLDLHIRAFGAVRRFYAVVLAVVSGIAALLALIGVYALTDQLVNRRMPDLAIRRSLGASHLHVGLSTVGGILTLAALALCVGMYVGVLAGETLRAILFGVQPSDGGSLAIVASMMLATVAAAIAGPLSRALRLSPMELLRTR